MATTRQFWLLLALACVPAPGGHSQQIVNTIPVVLPAGVLSYAGAVPMSVATRIWLGNATTDNKRQWTCDYSAAGFTQVPRVKPQALAVSQAASDAVYASMMPPTLTIASGAVVRPQSTTLGNSLGALIGAVIAPVALGVSGITVQCTATGF